MEAFLAKQNQVEMAKLEAANKAQEEEAQLQQQKMLQSQKLLQKYNLDDRTDLAETVNPRFSFKEPLALLRSRLDELKSAQSVKVRLAVCISSQKPRHAVASSPVPFLAVVPTQYLIILAALLQVDLHEALHALSNHLAQVELLQQSESPDLSSRRVLATSVLQGMVRQVESALNACV
jgi:hypothetical protein